MQVGGLGVAFVTLIGMLAWAPLHFSSSVVHLWEELCAEIGRWELWAVEGHLCNEQGPSRAVARCATDPGSELASEVTIEHHLRSSRHLFGHPELSQAKRLAHLKVPISELVFRERFCRKAISGKTQLIPPAKSRPQEHLAKWKGYKGSSLYAWHQHSGRRVS